MATPPPLSDEPRQMPATWPLLLVVALMLALGILCVQVVSWTRAYASGLAIWVAAEQNSASALRRYFDTGNEADYQRFLRELAVVKTINSARQEMQQLDPDYGLVRRRFIDGRVPAEDADGLIRLMVYFKYHPLMDRAVQLWVDTDPLVRELEDVGGEMHASFAAGGSTREREVLVSRADNLRLRLDSMGAEFGSTLTAASHQVVRLVQIVLPLVALLLVAMGLALLRVLDRRNERARQELREISARLEYQATHDSLTGLVNRRRFEAMLSDVIDARFRSGAPAALLYFDLDQFKVVNDACGHAAGDELLKQVAWRVRRIAGEAATLGRLGGDEFGLLAPGHAPDAALALGERIREAMASQRFFWNDKTFAVSASIGVLALGQGVDTVADALAAADHACYLAKDAGRDRVQLYRPDDREVRERRGEMHWVERLQAALDNNGFTLVAQEIRPVSFPHLPGDRAMPRRRFELLLRLPDPDGQPVTPMAFIPAAERYGLMPRIDRWVIATACRELAMLRAAGHDLPTCMVNLSGSSASDPTLADYIGQCLRENGLNGSCLGVELTETVAVGNLAACSELMARLRGMGCLIALDDFGTGMSSFSYLRNLPIDLLKIDRAFVRDIAGDPIDHALVETIRRIAAIMGVRTVAEGVETAEVLGALALIGVDFAQGSHVRPPVPLVQMLQAGGELPVRPAGVRSAVNS